MNTEIKIGTCPFCGSDKVKITSMRGKKKDDDRYYQGLCNKCFSRGPKKRTEDEAIEAWNYTSLGKYETQSKVDSEQLERLLNNEIVVQCKTQYEFNTLINTLEKYDITCSLKKWYLWGNYMSDTCVSVDEHKYFGYSKIDWYKEQGNTVEKIKLI